MSHVVHHKLDSWAESELYRFSTAPLVNVHPLFISLCYLCHSLSEAQVDAPQWLMYLSSLE